MNSEVRKSNYLKMRNWLDIKCKRIRELYDQNPKHCKNCNSIIPFEFKQKSFCNSICSGSFNTRGRHHSKETKIKISSSVKQSEKFQIRNKEAHPSVEWFSVCCICNSIMRNSHRTTCSKECYHISRISQGIIAGRKSASKRVLRSKNEIRLFDLLSYHYKCIHNEPIFNGWDADIIIPDLKLAILWNGIWHYEKVHKNHSISQVQNRDRIKLKEIQNCGYNYLIIKDHNNNTTPEIALLKIQESINNNAYNIEII